MDDWKELRLSSTHILVAYLSIFGMFFLFNLMRQPVVDWDEEVYLHLSEHMSWTLEHYTTQGSHIAEALPMGYYRSPVFHHPPLVPYGIKLLSFAGSLTGAKILNLILWGVSVFLVFAIARRFTDAKGAMLALALWVVCPIINLEARLVHLDFPCTVFTLLGFWCYLQYQDRYPNRWYLAWSGVAFTLAMLTKYTGPLLVVVPALLFISDFRHLRDWKAWAVYGGTIAFGFVWWFYVVTKFGSMMPPGFAWGQTTPTVTPYLKSISNRKWYDLWIYFLFICPLFLIYLGGAIKAFFDVSKRRWTSENASNGIEPLIAASAGIWIFVLIFSLINSQTNGFWMFRHILPVFPFIYIAIGVICSRLLNEGRQLLNAYLIVWVLFTLVAMIGSTAVTGLEVRNLKPVPVSLFWFNLGYLFH